MKTELKHCVFVVLIFAAVCAVTAQPYTVTTLAGLAGVTGSTDGVGAAARFYYASGLAVDNAGSLYVADTGNSTIRKITPNGSVSTFAGLAGSTGSEEGIGSAARFFGPGGLCVDSGGNVYVADSQNHTIRKITPSRSVSTIAGLAANPGTVDGTGSNARFYYPWGVAVDSTGNVYVSENNSHVIRKITSAGVVSTFAGLAGVSGNANGIGSTARFYNPELMATDNSGNVYVADNYNFLIRKITPGRVVTTFTGGSGSYCWDGVGVEASFKFPGAVATDGLGNLFVADDGHYTIRKITPAAAVSTVAGYCEVPGSEDGVGNGARFASLGGIAVNGAGIVFVSDDHTIRRAMPLAITSQPSNQTVNMGTNANFSVTAVGYEPISYQWRFGGYNLAGGTASNYVVINAQLTNAGDYSVIISNAAGSVTSAVASLTVRIPPQIFGQPQSIAVLPGQTANFKVSATGTAPLTYRWYRNGGSIAGATATNYSVIAQLANAGDYYVVVTNLAGKQTSEVAVLTVIVPPSFLVQPQSQSVFLSSNATFTASATGTAPLFYQWRFNGSPLLLETNSSLTVSNVQFQAEGDYSVIVTNVYGAAVSMAARLTAKYQARYGGVYGGSFVGSEDNGRFAFFVRTNGVSTALGVDHYDEVGDRVLSFQVNSDGGFSFTTELWGSLCSGTMDPLIFNGSGVFGGTATGTGNRLPCEGTYKSVGGYYVGQISGSISGPAYAIVAADGFAFLMIQEHGNPDASGGAYGTLAGSNPINFSPAGRVPSGLTLSGSINPSTMVFSGNWNYPSIGSGTFSLLRQEALPGCVPVFSTQPQDQSVMHGKSTVLSALASGSESLTYRWRKGGLFIPGSTIANLLFTNVQPTDAGFYDVVVSNDVGVATSRLATFVVTPFDQRVVELRPLGAGQYQIRVDGGVAGVFRLAGSTNLNLWTVIVTGTNATGTAFVTNSPIGLPPKYFYRAVP